MWGAHVSPLVDSSVNVSSNSCSVKPWCIISMCISRGGAVAAMVADVGLLAYVLFFPISQHHMVKLLEFSGNAQQPDPNRLGSIIQAIGPGRDGTYIVR